VRPDIFNPSELGLECFVGCRDNVVLFFERDKHFLDLERGLAKEVTTRKIGWVENSIPVRFID